MREPCPTCTVEEFPTSRCLVEESALCQGTNHSGRGRLLRSACNACAHGDNLRDAASLRKRTKKDLIQIILDLTRRIP